MYVLNLPLFHHEHHDGFWEACGIKNPGVRHDVDHGSHQDPADRFVPERAKALIVDSLISLSENQHLCDNAISVEKGGS